MYPRRRLGRASVGVRAPLWLRVLATNAGAGLTLLAEGCGSSAASASDDTGDGGALDGSQDYGGALLSDAREASAPSFTINALDGARVGSENSTGWTYVGRALADVDWKEGPFAHVALVVDLASACYPFEQWATHPPPVGQNWPADCDAFDRNFDVLLDDPAAAASTPFEIIHAVTPFGGPEHLEADITDLANARPGGHRLRFELVSFSDPEGLVTGSNGGWTITARIEVKPGDSPRRVLSATPLFAGRLSPEDALPVVDLVVPAGATGGRIEYRTSGHGQGPVAPLCLGPAEEFCRRQHRILVDGQAVKILEPYRQDCQTLCTVTHYGAADAGFDYCLENPCGALASVRAPRANWCPGHMTPPFSFEDIPALAVPGSHAFSFQISEIAAGGFWFVSAIHYAYGL